MRHFKKLALLLLILALAAPAAAESWPHEREGFTLGFNFGGGSATAKPDVGDESSGGGGHGGFRLGWALGNQFLLGFESGAWVGKADVGNAFDVDLTLASYKLNFTWYPSARGWFVRAGFGGGSADYSTIINGVKFSAEDTGGSFGFGAGHEWRLTRKFALGVAADFNTADLDEVKYEFWGFSAQFNWYF